MAAGEADKIEELERKMARVGEGKTSDRKPACEGTTCLEGDEGEELPVLGYTIAGEDRVGCLVHRGTNEGACERVYDFERKAEMLHVEGHDDSVVLVALGRTAISSLPKIHAHHRK